MAQKNTDLKVQSAKEQRSLRKQTRSTLTTVPSFDDLPDAALVRLSQLVRDPRHPERLTPLPISPATFWRKVKEGSFPKPIKLGARITAWKVGEVRAWIAAQTTN